MLTDSQFAQHLALYETPEALINKQSLNTNSLANEQSLKIQLMQCAFESRAHPGLQYLPYSSKINR